MTGKIRLVTDDRPAPGHVFRFVVRGGSGRSQLETTSGIAELDLPHGNQFEVSILEVPIPRPVHGFYWANMNSPSLSIAPVNQPLDPRPKPQDKTIPGTAAQAMAAQREAILRDESPSAKAAREKQEREARELEERTRLRSLEENPTEPRATESPVATELEASTKENETKAAEPSAAARR